MANYRYVLEGEGKEDTIEVEFSLSRSSRYPDGFVLFAKNSASAVHEPVLRVRPKCAVELLPCSDDVGLPKDTDGRVTTRLGV